MKRLIVFCLSLQLRLIQCWLVFLYEMTLIGQNCAVTAIITLDFKKRRDMKSSFSTLRNVSMHALSKESFMTYCAAVITAALT